MTPSIVVLSHHCRGKRQEAHSWDKIVLARRTRASTLSPTLPQAQTPSRPTGQLIAVVSSSQNGMNLLPRNSGHFSHCPRSPSHSLLFKLFLAAFHLFLSLSLHQCKPVMVSWRCTPRLNNLNSLNICFLLQLKGYFLKQFNM